MNLYWIGARQWDIYDNEMFSGSITRYGKDYGSHYSFCNNEVTNDFNEYMDAKLHQIVNVDDDAFLCLLMKRMHINLEKTFLKNQFV